MTGKILDDDWYEDDGIDKKYVRTERINQVEKYVLIGTVISILLWMWSFFSAFIGLSGFVHIGKFFVALPALIWWRSASINYDASPSVNRFVIPDLLKAVRVLLVFVGIFLCFSFFSTAWVLYSYFDLFFKEWEPFYLLPFLGATALNVALGAGYLYYWNITNKSMKNAA